jgi:hypothetical protein
VERLSSGTPMDGTDLAATFRDLDGPYNDVRMQAATWLATMAAHLRPRQKEWPALEAVYGRSMVQQGAVLETFMLGLLAFFKDPDRAPLIIQAMMFARVLDGNVREKVEMVAGRPKKLTRTQSRQLVRQLASTDEYMAAVVAPRLEAIQKMAGF